jgi:YbbR domain-containing protein
MKKKLLKITEHFKLDKLIDDKRVVVFLICLLIAAGLWFLNALNKDYTTTIAYPVKYINPPNNQFLANKPPSKLDLKVEAHGFTLLRHKLNLSFSPIILNLTSLTNNAELNSGKYSIRTNTLVRRISDQVSSEIKITDILPEQIQIELDHLKTKSVPVKVIADVEFEPQFNLKLPITSDPASIKITGPAAVLDTIYSIKTESQSFTKVDADIKKETDLVFPENISIEPQEVSLIIEVEKFTEKEMKIPLEVINKPENVKIKLFPSEIKLLFTVGLSEFDKLTPHDFKALVDYKSIKDGIENLDVSISKKPDGIEITRFKPATVEFLVEIE